MERSHFCRVVGGGVERLMCSSLLGSAGTFCDSALCGTLHWRHSIGASCARKHFIGSPACKGAAVVTPNKGKAQASSVRHNNRGVESWNKAKHFLLLGMERGYDVASQLQLEAFKHFSPWLHDPLPGVPTIAPLCSADTWQATDALTSFLFSPWWTMAVLRAATPPSSFGSSWRHC